MSVRRPSLIAGALLLCAGAAHAEVVKAKGYGDTPGAAITDAAANAIRTVSGSRVTVKQEFKSEIDKGIPDEKFLETMLEVSRGTIAHMDVEGVKQVGNIYEASIIVDVDPGKLQAEAGGSGQMKVQPGTLSAGVAEARLHKDAASQLQEAVSAFLSVGSKTVEVQSVSVEKHQAILDTLQARAVLGDGQIPVRIVFRYTSSPASISELKSALAAASGESPVGRMDSDTLQCDADFQNKYQGYVLLLHGPQKIPVRSASFWCLGTLPYSNVVSGKFPASVYGIDKLPSMPEATSAAALTIRLTGANGQKREVSLPFAPSTPRDRFPILSDGGYLTVTNVDGEDVSPYAEGGYSMLGGEYYFDPPSLSASKLEGLGGAPMLALYESMVFSVTIPMDATDAENLKSVEISPSRG